MKLKTVTLWLTLMLLAPCAYGQQTEVVLANKLRVRASLYEPLMTAAAARHNVDPRLLWTIAYLESRFRQEAINYKEGKPCAYGMMQFTAPTAARYSLKNPHDVKEAIDAAARYVRDLQKRFGARGDLILAAYNAGEGTVKAFRDGKSLVLPNKKIINPASIRTGGVPPYQETREYVARGKIVYQTISHEGLFAARVRASLDGPLNEAAESKASSENAPIPGSIYSSESGEKPPTQQTVKSAKTKGIAPMASSIYVN
jgi:soluble lytic murein transglycosylase-like protein